MAKEVVWSESTLQDRFNIYRYWTVRNHSATYSEKLDALFKRYAELIAAFPQVGVTTSLPAVRYKVIRDYKIFYKVENQLVVILRVWDVRQDPDRLKMD